jgi:hypothetical protein
MQPKVFFSLLRLVCTWGMIVPGRGEAWGDLAHQVICEIAFQELSPPVKAEVTRLLPKDPKPTLRRFLHACTWADHPRQRAAEHFLNLPRTQTAVPNSDPACPPADTRVLTAIAVVHSHRSFADCDKRWHSEVRTRL